MVTPKIKVAISFLLARCPSRLVRTNALRLLGGKKDIWSGKAQRYLRKKLFGSHPRTLGTGKAARDTLDENGAAGARGRDDRMIALSLGRRKAFLTVLSCDCRVSWRPGRASCGSSHVRYVPKATNNRLRTACRDGPCVDGSELARVFFTSAGFGRCGHVFGLSVRFT